MSSYNTELTSVRLSKSLTSDTESSRLDTQAHYIEITAEALNQGDDVNIFVHQLESIDPNSDTQGAFFTNVCSPADYNQLPVGFPSSNDDYTLFRLDKIRHYAYSHEELETLYDEVFKDVQALVKAFQRATNLESGNDDIN